MTTEHFHGDDTTVPVLALGNAMSLDAGSM
jgi:hypothetical protein